MKQYRDVEQLLRTYYHRDELIAAIERDIRQTEARITFLENDIRSSGVAIYDGAETHGKGAVSDPTCDRANELDRNLYQHRHELQHHREWIAQSHDTRNQIEMTAARIETVLHNLCIYRTLKRHHIDALQAVYGKNQSPEEAAIELGLTGDAVRKSIETALRAIDTALHRAQNLTLFNPIIFIENNYRPIRTLAVS